MGTAPFKQISNTDTEGQGTLVNKGKRKIQSSLFICPVLLKGNLCFLSHFPFRKAANFPHLSNACRNLQKLSCFCATHFYLRIQKIKHPSQKLETGVKTSAVPLKLRRNSPPLQDLTIPMPLRRNHGKRLLPPIRFRTSGSEGIGSWHFCCRFTPTTDSLKAGLPTFFVTAFIKLS